MSSNSSLAALASASTRGPSKRTWPGSRRVARRRKRRTTSLSGLLISWSLEGLFRNLSQPSKGTAVAHGQVSQHFAVDLHSGLAEAVHQLAVGQPRLPGGGVDASDPELPHLPLAAAPGAIEDRLVAAMRWDPALDACHLSQMPSARRTALRSLWCTGCSL